MIVRRWSPIAVLLVSSTLAGTAFPPGTAIAAGGRLGSGPASPSAFVDLSPQPAGESSPSAPPVDSSSGVSGVGPAEQEAGPSTGPGEPFESADTADAASSEPPATDPVPRLEAESPPPVADPPAPDAALLPQHRAYPPGRSPEELALRRHRRASLGMLIAGYSIFGTFYLGSMAYGAGEMDRSGYYDDDLGDEPYDDRQLQYGRRLFIPVVGPYIAAPLAPSASEALLVVLGGTAQIAGLALGITGSILYAKARRQQRLVLGGSLGPNQALMSVGARF